MGTDTGLMRILYIFPENLGRAGGGTVTCLGTVRALLELNHHVVVIAPKYDESLAVPCDVPCDLIRLPGRGYWTYLSFQIIVVCLFPWFVFKHRPEGVFLRATPGVLWLVCLWCRMLRLRCTSWFGGVPWCEAHSRGYGPCAAVLLRASATLCALLSRRCIAVTEAVADELARATGLSRDRVSVVPLGANSHEFSSVLRDEERKRRGYESRHFVVGLISLFAPWHGVLEVIESFSWLPEDIRSNIRYLLIGGGELLGRARQRVLEAGLESSVMLPGPATRDEVARFLAVMDVGLFVCSDRLKLRFPGSPLKFFEYLAAGLPVIVTDDSHLTPIVLSDNLGLVIRDSEPSVIAGAIAEMYRNRAKYAEVGRRNRAVAESKYSWRQVAKRTAEVLARS